MGNEQSAEGGSGSSSTLSFLQKAKEGISPKPVRTDKIIIVSSGGEPITFDPSQDEDLKKLQEIPPFFPILRGSLNHVGLKDPPDLYSKFSSKPVLKLCQRLQEHLAATSEVVASEQSSLGTRIREIDYATATLANYVSDRKKTFERLAADIQKVRDLNAQLKKIASNLQELVPTAQLINELLPPSERLPPLNLGIILEHSMAPATAPSTLPADSVVDTSGAIEEQLVVDRSL
uniref:BLOC-1-related complex subunit 5 n=1 Tax=Plectus sambesii TaxID=2011161 RepID=A0A914VGS3_9BILA